MLDALLEARPELKADAETIAAAHLATVSFEDVAKTVFAALDPLDLDDLDVPRPHDYIHPSEAAWQILEMAIEPFLADMKRRLKLRRDDEALEVCKGIVLGLYRFERSGSELLEHAVDCPSETAGAAVDVWEGRKRRVFPRAFARRFTPEWTWLTR